MPLRIPSIKPVKGREKQTRILNFLIRINVFAIPLYIVLFLGLYITQLQTIVANIEFYLLSSSGFSPSINGLFITIPIKGGSWGAFINWDCTAWKSMFAFFALVMATDYKLGSKLKGLAIFLPLIFIVNIARIFFMFYYVRTFDLAYYRLCMRLSGVGG